MVKKKEVTEKRLEKIVGPRLPKKSQDSTDTEARPESHWDHLLKEMVMCLVLHRWELIGLINCHVIDCIHTAMACHRCSKGKNEACCKWKENKQNDGCL